MIKWGFIFSGIFVSCVVFVDVCGCIFGVVLCWFRGIFVGIYIVWFFLKVIKY